ncbi:hypothetical protein [Marinicella sp. W31]|uniref:hypothetical protein n=1 Tax=Marinicella sp. W31 TaxID=3023713 RepID=UPI0037564CBF
MIITALKKTYRMRQNSLENNLVSDIDKIDQLITYSSYLFASALLFQLLAGLIVIVAILIIYKRSQRPGRTMMLGGMIFYILFTAPFFFAELVGLENLSHGQKIILMYLPLAASISLCIACFGFFKFALSFKKM